MPPIPLDARDARRTRWLVAVIPIAFMLVAAAYPSRQYHWDTLERAALLEHPGRWLKSWDGTPRSQFLSFAHVLELPLARLVDLVVPGPSLRALCVFEAVCGAAALSLIGAMVLRWRRALGAGGGDGRNALGSSDLRAVILAQAALAACYAFWKMGTSGEEKILALATQLLFLWCYWEFASGETAGEPRPGTHASFRRFLRANKLPFTLALAILSHLSAAVLVPFGCLALLRFPDAWRPRRGVVLRGMILGTLLAGIVYYGVAFATTGVRGPASFIDYLTFFHRAGGTNFFEPTGAPAATAESRLARALHGIGSFFSGEIGVGQLAALGLLGLAVVGWLRARRSGSLLATLHAHALLLGLLWTLHFFFFEPQTHESWTLLVALLILAATSGLPSGRIGWAGFALPLLLLAANRTHYAAAHRPLDYEAYRRVVARQTHPGDIVVLVGGMQNNQSLRGSLWMRFFLVMLPDRTYASLWDVLGITQREFWGRPFESPASLQAALDAGHRAWVPQPLVTELERANQTGTVRIAWEARGDSLVEIRHIESTAAR